MKTSSGIALAALALVVASSTAGYAGAKVTSGDIKNNTIASADIKNGTVGAADLNPALVRSVSIGKAYATVTRKETATSIVTVLDKTRTYGFSQLKKAPESEGIYCLVPARGVDLTHSAIMVSADFAQTAGIATVLWDSVGADCAPKEIEIHTLTDQGDDEPSPSDQVAFQVFAS
ncbi:hypothetical protein [Nocardioides sp.]|uniref:hypothetical protein n=1 Tax=Nocardioides sp. TaxID=35761 RepID=UPI0027181AB9|nr:hypothetical protein [Nocardioides sp.]MDO9455963.1 hypothetical protein [Nocardioides sp.]